jgi:hypothetical protein
MMMIGDFDTMPEFASECNKLIGEFRNNTLNNLDITTIFIRMDQIIRGFT